MDDAERREAARGLQAILDAVDRGELTADSLEEQELLLRVEGAVAALTQSANRSETGID